jgi:MFS family permease
MGTRHARNTLYLSGVEAFWGLGMNLLSMGTVLPVFLLERGASNAVIAFLPAMSALGAGLPQALSGVLGGNRARLKPLVMWLHVAASLPLGLAGALLLWGRLPSVPTVLACWALFYAMIGLVFPLWMDYMARILDPAVRGRALGVVFLTQTLAGVVGVTLAAAQLKGGTSDARYAVLFLAACVVIAGGSLFFFGTREEVLDTEGGRPTVKGHLGDLADLWRRLPWMRRYMLARWFVRGSYPLLIHFYAVYAVTRKGVGPAEAALYGSAALACQALVGVFAGWLGDHLGHKTSVLLGQGILLVACVVAVLPVPAWAFFIVAGLTGAFLATEYTSHAAWLMDLATPAERQSVMALVGFLITPASVLAPLAGGRIMDATGFRPVVCAVGLIVAVAFVIGTRVPAGRENGDEATG